MATEGTISLEKFADATQWEHVDYNVPVFIEHELWEVPHPWIKGQKLKRAVLPGEEKPKEGTLLYSIGTDELLQTASKINETLRTTKTPVVVQIGHRNPSLPEKQNPDTIAYGVGAKLGKHGNINAVLLDRICYTQGSYEEAKKYRHRSPEFKPMTGQLTGLALIKNDPKLPMGIMMTYQVDDVVNYGPEMNLEEKEPSKSQEAPKGQDAQETPPSISPKGTATDPTKPPTVAEPDQAKHAEWAQHMEYYKRNDPMMLQMCKNYETECAAAIAPEVEGEMGGEKVPGKEGGEKPPMGKEKSGKPKGEPKEQENMASEDATVQYAALAQRLDAQEKANKDLTAKVDILATVNGSLTTKYAESEGKRILARLKGLKVIKDPKKLLAKLAGAADDAARKAIFDDVIENYADLPSEDRDPSQGGEIDVSLDYKVEGAEESDPVIEPMDMTAAVKYAEENKLDFDKDYDKICAAMKVKGKPVAAK